jgi:solute carrier family 25 (adenine nucleotide translocator) protein 4/5/6/31
MMNYYKQVAVRPFLSTRFLSSKHLPPEQLERRRKNLTSLVAGGMAGGTATTLLYPVEFLRTRLAADLARGEKTGSYKFKGMRHAFTTILKSDGPTGLYQGYGIALFGGIYYRILFLGGYDVLKSEWELRNEHKGKPGLAWGERLAIAQTISLSAGALSYPLDSVRRRLMMQAGQPYEGRKYRNSIHCIRLVLAQEGVRGFFLGMGPNILRSVSGALLLVAYDMFKEGLT